MRALALVVLLAGCRTQPLEQPPPDLSVSPDLSRPPDLGCAPRQEECNGYDDDCDGEIDEGCVRRIDPTAGVTADRVRISGDRVVYSSTATWNSVNDIPFLGDSQLRIFSYDLVTGTGTALSARGKNTDLGVDTDTHTAPDFDGEWAVWLTNDGMQKVSALHLPTQKMYSVGAPMVMAPTEVVVSANRVIFAAGASGRELWQWQPLSNLLTRIANGPGQHSGLALEGQYLLCSERANDQDKYALVLRDLDGVLPTRTLSDGLPAGNHQAASISKNRVVWHREYAEMDMTWRYHYELWTAEIAGSAPKLLLPAEASNPRVDGDLICYQATGTSGTSVRVMSLLSGKSALISTGAFGCDISGRRVVWLANRNSNLTLAYERPLAPNEP